MQEQREERNKKNQECMSLEGFCRYMKTAIQQRLGSDCLVSMHQVTKNNGLMLQGLTVEEQGNPLCPNIYLDGYYEKYMRGIVGLEEIEEQVLECYKKNRVVGNIKTSSFIEWETARHRIVYRLINEKSNAELLADVPHKKFLDLAVVPYYVFEINTETGMATALIHQSHLELWNITEQQVFDAAQQNTPKFMPFVLKSMADIMADMLEVPMHVLTNSYKLYGAGCMLYQNVLADFAEKLNSDLYILPSSVHEVMILPVMGKEKDAAGLSEMVRKVNETQVSPEEILSDHVYQFSRKTGQITM